MKKESSKKKKTPLPSTKRYSQINASSTLSSYSKSKRKGESPTVIEIDESKETTTILKKKKGDLLKEFLKSINRSSKSIYSLKKEGSSAKEQEKEMMESNNSWDDFNFMDFKPSATLSKQFSTPSKSHTKPSNYSFIPP